jgi:hypothetical protein
MTLGTITPADGSIIGMMGEVAAFPAPGRMSSGCAQPDRTGYALDMEMMEE